MADSSYNTSYNDLDEVSLVSKSLSKRLEDLSVTNITIPTGSSGTINWTNSLKDIKSMLAVVSDRLSYLSVFANNIMEQTKNVENTIVSDTNHSLDLSSSSTESRSSSDSASSSSTATSSTTSSDIVIDEDTGATVASSIIAGFVGGELTSQSTVDDIIAYVNNRMGKNTSSLSNLSTTAEKSLSNQNTLVDKSVSEEELASHYFTNSGKKTNEAAKTETSVVEPVRTNTTNTTSNNTSQVVKQNTEPVTETPPSDTPAEPVQEVVEENPTDVTDATTSSSITDSIEDSTTDLFDIEDEDVGVDATTDAPKSKMVGVKTVVPIVGGVGAAAIGIGAKIYKDRKENNELDLDEDRPSNDNKFWSDDESNVIHSEKEMYGDEISLDEEVNKETAKYTASNNNVESDDLWDAPDTLEGGSGVVDLLGN